MFVKNLTTKVQKVKVQELIIPSREYCFYLEPNSCTELVGVFVTNKKELEGLVEFDKRVPVTEVVPAPVEKYEAPQVVEESEEVEEASEKVEVLDSKFICDLCGAEFASSRGLASHKARVHDNQ